MLFLLLLLLLLIVFLILVLGKKKNKVSILSPQKKVRVKKKIEVNTKLEERFCHAGMFLEDERKEYYKDLKLYPLIFLAVGLLIGFVFFSSTDILLKILIAGFAYYLGHMLPSIKLDKKIKKQKEDIVYYLPITIEQLIIGVSAGLDVGPCISDIVKSCRERGTHNAVTLLLEKVEYYVKSGNSLDDALVNIGKLSGHTELKQTFMQISQVSRHGGEIASQLKELADAVTNQQEIAVDGTIRKLELKATMPLTLAFVGNLGMLMAAIFMNIIKAFK